MTNASRTKKASSKKTTGLPGSKLTQHLNLAKKQTKDLLTKSKKKVASANATQQGHAKKHKQAQVMLKKHESKHKNSPTKHTAKNISVAKSKVKSAADIHVKSQKAHRDAIDSHATHQNHFAKLNHMHKLVTDAERNFSNKTAKSANRSNRSKSAVNSRKKSSSAR